MSFSMDKNAMRKIEEQARKALEPIEKEANAAAAKEDSADAKARAFAKVLREHGVDVDEREIRKQFEA